MKLKTFYALALLFLAPVAVAQTSVDETKAVTADGIVGINNVSGSVLVVGWDRAEVQVTGTLERSVERLDFEVRDGRTEIKVVPSKLPFGRKSAQLTIHVPVLSRLDIETVSASVTVENPAKPVTEGNAAAESKTLSIHTVSGDVKANASAQTVNLETVSGDISFSGTADTIKSESVSGDIECAGAISSFATETISGDVTANGIQRDAEVSTVSGQTKLGFDMIGNATLSSVSGDTSLEGRLAPDGWINTDTQSGDITIRLSDEVSAEVDARTLSGDIVADLGGSTPPVEKEHSSHTLRYSIGTGTAVVRLSTGSGDISLLRKN